MTGKDGKRIVIAGSCRTPLGAFGGSLRDVSAQELLTVVFKETIRRTGIDSKLIDEAYAACIAQPSDAPNIARVAAVDAGIPLDKPAFTVQRNCASGIQAIISAVQAIKAGDGEIFLIGGTESMSRIPFMLKDHRWGRKLQNSDLVDALWEGLTDPHADHLMGFITEQVAKKHGVSREEQDKFAVRSHQKALKAQKEGKFKGQIVPVEVKKVKATGQVEKVLVSEDGGINPMFSEQIAKMYPTVFDEKNLLKPVIKELKRIFRFKFDKVEPILKELGKIAEAGTITPGNACPITDGAAAMLVMTEEKAKELNIIPEAYIVSYAFAATDPVFMGEGPIYAVPKALERAGLKIEDIDFFEINEAFAAQAVPCQRVLGIPDEKLNVWGGAIALGHPVGATGAVLTTKLIAILKDSDKDYGIVSMCVGGGQGGALIIHNWKEEASVKETSEEKKMTVKPKPIFKIVIIGGGAMGADLAALMARQNLPVVIKELNLELAKRAKEKVCQRIDGWVQKGKISQSEADFKKSLVSVTDNYGDLQEKGLLVIEAVPEKLELKQQIFSELELSLPIDAILASNTSSLPIRLLAAKMEDRSRLVGLHFFNPPTKMPLVEVIPSKYTSEETVLTVEDFVKTTLQKVPIRVKDRPGFLVNVLLAAYLKPVIAALEENIVSLEAIDKEATEFGWPLGPYLLMDMLGLDVCQEVTKVLNAAYGERFGSSRILALLVEKNRLGQKSGAGFYSYNEGLESLETILEKEFPNRQSAEAKTIFGKMMTSFIEEAKIAFQNGVASKEDIEAGCVYGLGFPPHKSGPLHLAGGFFEEW